MAKVRKLEKRVVPQREEPRKQIDAREADQSEVDAMQGIESGKGLACPTCGCRDFHVVYTEKKDGHIMRRRACRHCGKRVTTKERIL